MAAAARAIWFVGNRCVWYRSLSCEGGSAYAKEAESEERAEEVPSAHRSGPRQAHSAEHARISGLGPVVRKRHGRLHRLVQFGAPSIDYGSSSRDPVYGQQPRERGTQR